MPTSGRAKTLERRAGHSNSTSARFAASFFSRLSLVVRLRQKRIAPRIPSIGVDAVEDAVQIGGARREHAVEAEPVFLGLDFARVGRADRRDAVGKQDAALEQADLPPELERVHRQHLGAQLERRRASRAGKFP